MTDLFDLDATHAVALPPGPLDTRINLRALSWKQPYLHLMFNGKIETRTWPTKNARGANVPLMQYSGVEAPMTANVCGLVPFLQWRNCPVLGVCVFSEGKDNLKIK